MQHIDKAIYKRVFEISLPAIAGFLSLIMFDIIDIFWIEKLGTMAVAGVASASFIVWGINAIITVTSSGCASLVSKHHGAGNQKKAWETITQSSWLSLLISLVICMGFYPLIERPFHWMGLEPDTITIAVGYFKIILFGFPIIYLDMLSGNIFNAYGDNRISNGIMVLCLFLNMVLDPIMMFGWWIFPAMGTNGAALATIISHIISLLLRIYVLKRKGYIPPFWHFIGIKTSYYQSIIKIGMPPAAAGFIWSMVYPFLTRLITPFGIIPLSAVGICHRLESFPYFTACAFGIAMTSLVGFSIGRKENDKIEHIVTAGMRISALVQLPFLILFLVFPHWLMGLMSSNPLLVAEGAEYLYIIGLLEIFMGWEMVLVGVFTGLGITYPTLFITVPFTIGRIPLAWFLAYYLEMGSNGIWWAISISTFAKGLGLYLLYIYMKKKTNNFTSLTR